MSAYDATVQGKSKEEVIAVGEDDTEGPWHLEMSFPKRFGMQYAHCPPPPGLQNRSSFSTPTEHFHARERIAAFTQQ